MSRDDLYLTDAQYVEMLRRMRQIVSAPNWVGTGHDDTTPGDKSTTTNGGLCADRLYATPETVMFPSQFPHRTSLKYRREEHLCPLDERMTDPKKRGMNGGGSWGCFYTCRIFRGRRPLGSKEAVALVGLALWRAEGFGLTAKP